MKIYLVGGAVRDKLLGWPVKERDWVVVGATINDMLGLGYRQVGKEFPVFLHPKTNEEYALARMERKTGPGYKGFAFDTSPHVSLEDDLSRRDLTINAMAESADNILTDPFHGKADLEAKLLRHVSPAFAEDPVRILRIGRFYARFSHLGFHIAPETIALMRDMVKAGEVDALVPERVWKELERALGEKNPEKFFEALEACGALVVLFPGLDMQSKGMQSLIIAANLSPEPIVRFATLLHHLPDAKTSISNLCQRYKLPIAYRELAILTAAHYQEAFASRTLTAEALVKLLGALDIYRREARFHDFLTACQAIAAGHQVNFDPEWLHQAAHAAKSVDIQTLVAKGLNGQALADEIQKARLDKMKLLLSQD
jgi:tRNA nucleotidyltransferase (CCA-adding enzyme)